eukprot:ANDGO_03090.mRNA.1 hypothetical protein
MQELEQYLKENDRPSNHRDVEGDFLKEVQAVKNMVRSAFTGMVQIVEHRRDVCLKELDGVMQTRSSQRSAKLETRKFEADIVCVLCRNSLVACFQSGSQSTNH